MTENRYKLLNDDYNQNAASTDKRLLFQFLIIVGGGVISVLLLFCDVNAVVEERKTDHFQPVTQKQNFSESDTRFAIRTEGCTIPGMDPFSDEIKPYVYFPKDMQKCFDSRYSLLVNNATHIWTHNLTHYNVTDKKAFNCCYKAFYRPNSISNIYSYFADNRVMYKECNNFSNVIQINDEFVKVTCSYKGHDIHSQFFLSVVPKIRKQVAKSNYSTYNVVVLGLDGVSRLNLHRTMPRTISILENNGAIEFMGYNKVEDNSYNNIVPLLMGYNSTEIKRICHPSGNYQYDNCPFIWNLFKDLGYYTAFTEDSALMGTFNLARAGFLRKPTDYYIHTFLNQERGKRLYSGPPRPLCMHDKYFYKVQLDYFENLAYLLQPYRLFGFFWEVTMTHDYLNHGMVIDSDYVELLKRWRESNYLDETVLIILSDHGIRYGKVRTTKQGSLEERLPVLIVLTPPSFRKKYKEAYNHLKLNSRRLTTPFDVHAMMSDLANLDKIKDETIISRSKQQYGGDRAISLFLPIPPNRTCLMAEISGHWCTCHDSIKISTTAEEAVKAVHTTVKSLNDILKNNKECEKLTLAKILHADEITWNGKKQYRDFMIVFRTKPGNGEFEATIRKDKGRWTVVSLPSRINLYRDQSHCVDDAQLKLYCYCKDQKLQAN